MEKEMLEMFIYYVIAIIDESSQDYNLDTCEKRMDVAIQTIGNQSLEIWNEYLVEAIKEKEHPVLNIQRQLMKLSKEEYLEKLNLCKELIEKYYKYGVDVEESLYLLNSEQDVENLAIMIILNSKKTSEIKEMVDNIQSNTIENVLIINEMCNRYTMGSGTEQNLTEAVKGFEIIAEYCAYAKRSLAIHLWSGKGVEKNCKKAFQLFNELMQKGDVVSKFYVAEMLYYGEGIPKDTKMALELFNSLIGKTSKYFEKKIFEYINNVEERS